MPDISNKVPGDQFYPDYSRIVTLVAAVAVKKGRMYTIQRGQANRDGHLVSWANSAAQDAAGRAAQDIADFTNGVYQAIEDGAVGDKVQCFSAGSRIGIKAKAGLVVGQKLTYDYDESNGEGRVAAYGTADAANIKGHVGRIFEIYTGGRDIEGDGISYETEANDIVIVELGMA